MDCAPPPPPLGSGGVPKISRLTPEEAREVKLQRALEMQLPSLEQIVAGLVEPILAELMAVDAGTQYTHDQYTLIKDELYPKYITLLEEVLEVLLAENESSAEELYEAAKAAAERGQPWPSADFLAAADDFHRFLALVESTVRVATR